MNLATVLLLLFSATVVLSLCRFRAIIHSGTTVERNEPSNVRDDADHRQGTSSNRNDAMFLPKGPWPRGSRGGLHLRHQPQQQQPHHHHHHHHHYLEEEEQQQQQLKRMLNMTLCEDKCDLGTNCKSYLTPLDECYNAGTLFPDDPSWSGRDVFDSVICQTLIRNIFGSSSSNGTASCVPSPDNHGDGGDDRFLIPMNECVGPFGQPRPWGYFQLTMPTSSSAPGGSSRGNGTTTTSDDASASLDSC
jgi:hypothetical protein